jgi:hypothetical protein
MRRPLAILAPAALAIALSGCTAIKPGTFTPSQPAGIGPVSLRITLCTLFVGEPPPGSEIPTVACGAPNESGQGQMLVTLMVPVGASTPEAFSAVPGPNAAATTFTRSPELTAKMRTREFTPGSVGPPPGFEVAGYSSGTVAESSAQEFTWTIEPAVGLPAGAGGGSYGGPLKATVIAGWRKVTAELPSSRPISCEEAPPGEAFCGVPEPNGEATIGVSDLKIRPAAAATAVPGTKLKLPFVLDFASSAAVRPTFALATTTTLPNAGLSLSSSSFSRGPTEPATRRAPPTTRKAIVQVPASARLGSYELALTATANQGGVATGSTTLTIKPKGTAKVTVPKRVKAQAASGSGIPVKLTAPIAGTRFRVALQGPRPNGRGKLRLLSKVRVARQLGTTVLRFRLARAQAEAYLALGAGLRIQATVAQPGLRRPKRVVAALKLR